MSDDPMPQAARRLCSQIREALARLYDSAYLVSHPLLHRIPGCLERDAMSAAQNLRRILLQAIEELRPPPPTAPDDPSWRPYLVLQHRYVLGKDTDAVEKELGLSRRQRQREQQRGIEAMAIGLCSRYPELQQEAMAPGPDDPLWQELSRAVTDQVNYDVAEQVQRALASVRPLARARGAALEAPSPEALSAWGNPTLLGQLLVSVLSFVIRSCSPARVALRLVPRQTATEIEIVASLFAAGDDRDEPAVPDIVMALCRIQNATLTHRIARGQWRLVITLPAPPREYTVAMLEDNQDVRALVSRYLAGHGYRLVYLDEGARLLEQVAAIMPDVLILDVILSRTGGWDILQSIKADPALAGIPVIICSVVDDPELATSLGAVACLRKPVRQGQLLECLANVLGH